MPQPANQNRDLRTSIPGPKSKAMRAREDVNLAPGAQGYPLLAGVAIDHAAGTAVTDVDGNTYLDFIGGIAVAALGYSHPTWVKAIQDQVVKTAIGSFTSQPRVELLERFAAHRPANEVVRLQLYSSGAEAVESALRLAKSHTGKYEFVSCSGGFHGKTMGALSLMGSTFKNGMGPMVPGAHQIPYADCYRCPFSLEPKTCGLACVDVARKHLKTATAGAVAAFIVEPMQGTAGNIVPPKDFLPALAALAKEHDALFIADEMITGLGRTGTWWGIEHSGVTPDIVTMGKAVGGGFPLSALATTSVIASAKPWSNTSGSSSSYGGNPLAAAAGAASLRIIEEEHLVENARAVGAVMLGILETWVERYPFVGHVRGAGMFMGLELVSDKQTKTPLPRTITERIFQEGVRRGLFAMTYAPSVRLQPPLTTDEATARNGLAILEEVFDWVAEEGLWKA
jgi:4-aminobutyrate aminotransferase/(S)-3-amino-2-methylpropionate transaminase